MRRTLNDDEAREVLTRGTVGRLGCVDEGEPYVVPINYVFADGFVYAHSLPGKKIDAMRKHPRACLQVDAIETEMRWKSVIANGEYEEVSSVSERRAILSKLLDRFPKLTPVESVMAHDAAAPDPIVFRIRVREITGVGED